MLSADDVDQLLRLFFLCEVGDMKDVDLAAHRRSTQQ